MRLEEGRREVEGQLPVLHAPRSLLCALCSKNRSGPVSRVLSRAIISLGCQLPGTSTRPTRTSNGTDSSSALLGLAPGGVCPAIAVAGDAVRSYRTISPLPVPTPESSLQAALYRLKPGLQRRPSAVCFLWHFPDPRGRWMLSTTVSCGARTFLPVGDPWNAHGAIAQPTPVEGIVGEDACSARGFRLQTSGFEGLGGLRRKERSSPLSVLAVSCDFASNFEARLSSRNPSRRASEAWYSNSHADA